MRGRLAAGVPEERGDLLVLRDLLRATRAFVEVATHDVGLLGVHRIEREGTEGLGQFVVVHESIHGDSTPRSESSVRSRNNPERILLLMVPSGSPRSVATSR